MVSVGDRIAREQPVLELETDKANFELPSSVSGVVQEIHVRAGACRRGSVALRRAAATGATAGLFQMGRNRAQGNDRDTAQDR